MKLRWTDFPEGIHLAAEHPVIWIWEGGVLARGESNNSGEGVRAFSALVPG